MKFLCRFIIVIVGIALAVTLATVVLMVISHVIMALRACTTPEMWLWASLAVCCLGVIYSSKLVDFWDWVWS